MGVERTTKVRGIESQKPMQSNTPSRNLHLQQEPEGRRYIIYIGTMTTGFIRNHVHQKTMK